MRISRLDMWLNKNINIIMEGSGMALPGKLVSVADGFFVMETRFSSKQYFDTARLVSFWCDEDKPND